MWSFGPSMQADLTPPQTRRCLEEKMFESEFDYTLERENMERVRNNVASRWGDRWGLSTLA